MTTEELRAEIARLEEVLKTHKYDCSEKRAIQHHLEELLEELQIVGNGYSY